MAISKSDIIEAIKALPQKEFANVDDWLQEIVTIAKIEKGLKNLAKGDVISEEEMGKAIAGW